MERVVVFREGNQITIPAVVVKTLTPEEHELDAFRLFLEPEGKIILEPIFIRKEK